MEIDLFNFEKNTCKYLLSGGWCDIPKYKRCKNCLRMKDGEKACEIMI